MAAQHPSTHLWPALQRRFGDQNKPSTAPDRLLRGLCIVPLEGQEEAMAWNLGFKEVGSSLRTASLSRDFGSVANMVDPEAPCYLVVYVGDVQQTLEAGRGAASSALELQVLRDWILISYVPSSCSSFEAKKMADNRSALKAGLGPDRFVEGGMWCVHVEQISLSNYMRSAESGGATLDGRMDVSAEGSGSLAAAQQLASVKLQDVVRHSDAPAIVANVASLGGSFGGEEGVSTLTDATEAIWEERIKNVRGAYADSCGRLVGALEELEETLCNLSGQQYRQDEPVLRARIHMQKNLEAMSLGQR